MAHIDVVVLVAKVRRGAGEMIARRGGEPETLDEMYREVFERGGRARADRALDALRAIGGLGTLRCTPGHTHIVDREGYAKLVRGLGSRVFCSDPYCEGKSHYTWEDFEEFTEDGKLAVHVRRQERRDGT